MKTILIILLFASLQSIGQTKKEVYDYIIKTRIEHPDIVFRQVLKETGHLKCTHCSMDHNNPLGFRYKHKHLEFDTWKESIDYYKRWQIRKKYTGGDYYEFLKEKWGAPDMDGYCRTLKQIKI